MQPQHRRHGKRTHTHTLSLSHTPPQPRRKPTSVRTNHANIRVGLAFKISFPGTWSFVSCGHCFPAYRSKQGFALYLTPLGSRERKNNPIGSQRSCRWPSQALPPAQTSCSRGRTSKRWDYLRVNMSTRSGAPRAGADEPMSVAQGKGERERRFSCVGESVMAAHTCMSWSECVAGRMLVAVLSAGGRRGEEDDETRVLF